MGTAYDLDQATKAAGRELLTLYRLMAARGIPGTIHLRLMEERPSHLDSAYEKFMSALVHLIVSIAHQEGIQDAMPLPLPEKERLAEKAYDLILNSPVGGDIRPQLAEITGRPCPADQPRRSQPPDGLSEIGWTPDRPTGQNP